MDFKIELEKFLKNLKCAICHDVLIDATVTNCGHSFCEWCIKKWENEKFDILANGDEKLPKCPMCNTEFETLSSNHMLKNHIEEMCNLLLSEEDKSDRQKTMIQHSDNMSNIILSANEAIAEFEAALQLDVHPENGTNSQMREYARVCSLALRYERAANARGVGTGAPSVFTTAPETAPEELIYPPNSVNTVQIPIETIDIDDWFIESDDDVNPDHFNAPTDEGMTHIMETAAPATVETVRQETNQENIDAEIERAANARESSHLDEISRPLVERNLSSANDIENNSPTVETSRNFGDIQAQMRADNRRYQEMEQYQSNGSNRDMPRPHVTVSTRDNPRPQSTCPLILESQRVILARQESERGLGRHTQGHGSNRDMPRPDSTGQDTDIMSSNRHSQGHGSNRRAPRPRSSPYNLDDRHRNRG